MVKKQNLTRAGRVSGIRSPESGIPTGPAEQALRLVTLLVSFGLLSSLWAEGGMPGAFLNYAPAPRSLAMGKTFTAVADDAQAGYFNPGGLFQLNAQEVLLAHSQLYGARMEHIGYALPTREHGTMALSVANFGAEDIPSRDITNDYGQSFAFHENAFIASYCYNPWNFLGFGVNAKLATKYLTAYQLNDVGMGLGVDVGALITVPRPFSLGVCAQNVVQPSLKLKNLPERYPRILRAGIAARLLDGRAVVAADVAAVDFLLNDRRFLVPHGGLELEILRGLLFQRVGIDPNEVSLGLGIQRDWGKMGIGVDYAILLHHQSGYLLSPTHKVGVSVNFAGFRVWIDAEPRVFSPAPENKQNVLWMDVRVLSRAPVKRWQLQIKNGLGEVVRSYSGWDAPPLRMSWDGLDDVGRLVADGRYTYEIVIVDRRNSPLEFSGFLTEVRTKGPRGRIEINQGE